MNSAESPQIGNKPVLLVDIDGVISLFGFEPDKRPCGIWHAVEGVPHFFSSTAAEHLHELDGWFDLVWCSGWEERADEHLPALLGVPRLPHLSFDDARVASTPPSVPNAHWKLGAIDAHLGDRPAAWVDDCLDEACQAWAAARRSPTLLVRTEPHVGLTADHVAQLRSWAGSVAACPAMD